MSNTQEVDRLRRELASRDLDLATCRQALMECEGERERLRALVEEACDIALHGRSHVSDRMHWVSRINEIRQAAQKARLP